MRYKQNGKEFDCCEGIGQNERVTKENDLQGIIWSNKDLQPPTILLFSPRGLISFLF
jgi:hypothetical protein